MCTGRLLQPQPCMGSCWAATPLSGHMEGAAGPATVNTPGQGPGWHHFAPMAPFMQGHGPTWASTLLAVSNMFLLCRLPVMASRGMLRSGDATDSREVLQGHYIGISETPWGITRLRCIP